MTDRKATGPLLEYIQTIGIGKTRLEDTEEAAWQEEDDERGWYGSGEEENE